MDTDWWAVVAEGLIGGAVVLLGVVVGAIIERRRSRRRAIEVAYHVLDDQLSVAVAGLVRADEDRSYGSAWWQAFRDVSARLGEIQLEARGIRRAKVIAREARLLNARLSAAMFVLDNGERLSGAAAADPLSLHRLRDAIFGRRLESWKPGQFDAVLEEMAGHVQP